MILTTINDYPANFSLSGQIKGKKRCIVCLDAMTSDYLDGSKKVVYTKYCCYLVQEHRYHRKQFNNHFDGKDEKASAPKIRHDSKHDFDMVGKINICYGKKVKRTKPPLKACLSKSSQSSLSTCHIGRTWRFHTPSIVCT